MVKSIREMNVLVRSNKLGEKELESTKQRVLQWRNQGHSSMAIMFFLSQYNHTVSETLEDENIILTVD